MDELFGEAPGPVPQGDDEDGEEDEENQLAQAAERESMEQRRPLRRSISSHPRFMSAEERTAREAATRVAEEERRKSQGTLRSLFASLGRKTNSNRTEYMAVRSDEH